MYRKFITIAFITCFATLQLQAQNKTTNTAANIAPVCYDTAIFAGISQEMYTNGNPKYIWVDLLKDGYLQENENYNLFLFTHTNDELLQLNNDKLPTDVVQTYVAKWKQFVAANNGTDIKTYIFSLSNYMWSVADITNENSDFRHITLDDMGLLEFRLKDKLIIAENIKKDGLCSDDNITIKTTRQGENVVIGNTLLDAAQQHKYQQLFKQYLGIELSKTHINRTYAMWPASLTSQLLSSYSK